MEINRAPIQAQFAQEGESYFTEMNKKVKVKKIHKIDGVVTSVSVEQPNGNTIGISGATTLYKEEEQPQAQAGQPSSPQQTVAPSAEKQEKVGHSIEERPDPMNPNRKIKKLKMSHIMNPMIFEGRDPEEIADAVIAQFPEKADKRKELIVDIKGPRTYDLKKKYPEKFDNNNNNSKAVEEVNQDKSSS
ncbi:MAG: hypothetical protein M0R03_16140 [Novosphingobium sp.]|nr:hypothetical protein [Novosphingobium sp.]